jgi:hypothetical protein
MPLEKTSIEVWYKIIGVELTSPFVCSKAHAKNTKGGSTGVESVLSIYVK